MDNDGWGSRVDRVMSSKIPLLLVAVVTALICSFIPAFWLTRHVAVSYDISFASVDALPINFLLSFNAEDDNLAKEYVKKRTALGNEIPSSVTLNLFDVYELKGFRFEFSETPGDIVISNLNFTKGGHVVDVISLLKIEDMAGCTVERVDGALRITKGIGAAYFDASVLFGQDIRTHHVRFPILMGLAVLLAICSYGMIKKEKYISLCYVINLIFMSLCFSASWILYYRQHIRYNSSYWSDINAHLFKAIDNPEYTSYSLVHKVFKFLYEMSGMNVFLPLAILALFSVSTVWTLYLLIRHLAPDSSPYLQWGCAWICFFTMAYWIPGVSFRYRFTASGEVWHNPTFIFMRPLACLSLLFYFILRNKYLQKINWRRWLVFMVLLTLSTSIKPSFIFCFAPAMAIFLLLDLIQHKWKALTKTIVFGGAVLPSLVLCIIQADILFIQETSNGNINSLALGFFELQRSHGFKAFIAIALSFVFPSAIIALLWKRVKGQFYFQFISLMTIVASAQSFFLYEDGPRKADGNFNWGIKIAGLILFVACVCALLRWMSEKDFKMTEKRNLRKCAVLWLLLLVHAGFGAMYYITILCGYGLENYTPF